MILLNNNLATQFHGIKSFLRVLAEKETRRDRLVREATEMELYLNMNEGHGISLTKSGSLSSTR
jgi:hypothetical protein